MITIDKVDFSKLKPYDGKVAKCFEQLCYQIAQREYGHLGKFTPIDGAGGDGGVEFYLELSSGEKWGWQCKFHGDTGRLSVGSRKSSISNSLETACRNHPNLTKWILCLKIDLTEDSTAPDGTVSHGERHWFRNELINKIPSGSKVSLDYCGASNILTFLGSIKHQGIRQFFFGDLEFTEQWFNQKFNEAFEKVKDKYDSELHTVNKYSQSRIDFLLFDQNYNLHLSQLRDSLLKKYNDIQTSVNEFRNEVLISPKEELQRNNFALYCDEFSNHIAFLLERIEFVEKAFRTYNEEDVYSKFSFNEIREHFQSYFEKIDYSVFEDKSRAYREALNIHGLISEISELCEEFFGSYFHEKYKELHIIGSAAKGKTHLSCNIAYSRINSNKPAIFFTGDKFTDANYITDAILRILDINNEYTFDDFLGALDVYGSIIGAKVPIVIDGLNETTYARLFSPIWKNHLTSFVTKVTATRNLVIVTTCRRSYVSRIWDNIRDRKFYILSGFEDDETIHEAINKYFKKYRLKANLFFASVERFREPIFLKIFCEIKNPNWKSGIEKEVNIEEESSFDIFNEYLRQVNKRVTESNHLFKSGESFISESLTKISQHLWEGNLREIPVKVFYSLIDGDKEYRKDESKADILIHEGLVVTRDMREGQEYVSFTYDILAGFMIGQHLINKNAHDLSYFVSSSFTTKINGESKQHPLYEDVVSSICLLLPQLKQTTLHEVVSNYWKLKFIKSRFYRILPKAIKSSFKSLIEYANLSYNYSISSLFTLNGKYVSRKNKDRVFELLQIYSNKEFFDLIFKTLSNSEHPLNAYFLYDGLKAMPMNKRDISWTEYIRKKGRDLLRFINEFEAQSRILDSNESEIIIQKQHTTSRVVLWFLTSTNRELRDSATRALYFYGRKFPIEFSELVYKSLSINDPYVWERTLCALFGVVMSEHNSFDSSKFTGDYLPKICIEIYKLMFKSECPHSTTHILARSYASGILEIGLLHDENLFTEPEIADIRPPYTKGGIRSLGEFDYGEKDYGYDLPLNMDFSNYTLGRLVKDGDGYSNPPEKQKLRRQIYWRIKDLGWEREFFKQAENDLGNETYYTARTSRAKTERYGKKYSWIAYFENAGLRSDLGILKNDYGRFRLSDSDIDPSFPEKPINEIFISEDILGDRSIPLFDWYSAGATPNFKKYVEVHNLKELGRDWVCLDGFICQEDKAANRRRFVFFQGFLVKESDFDEAIALFRKQNLEGRWLPEVKSNHYTYAGEMYYNYDSTSDNDDILSFIVNEEMVKVKTKDLSPLELFHLTRGVAQNDIPEEIEQKVRKVKEFEIQLPVMEYSWETYHCHLNEAGGTTVVSKEIARHLKLVDLPQTFDLFDNTGTKASLSLSFFEDYNNSHNFVYLRKDLLQKYLSDNKLKFIMAIWGEREISFKTEKGSEDFFKLHPYNGRQIFQEILEVL